MPLEAVMLCIDNSEWMRNGDYSPSRLEAQAETANYIANGKINDNPETEVGLLALAGSRVEVHTSMSRSMGVIMSCLQKDVKIGGTSKFIMGLKIAQLALKNRQNKNQKQRIVLFVGSPVLAATKDLVKIGKGFKKNNIAVDVINFGAENSTNENAEKLEALVAAVNSSDNSHLVNVPPGPHVLSDLVLSSSIMVDTPAGAAAAASAVGGVAAAGPDADMDQDLAMAIRMSMEDERQRQERLTTPAAATTPSPATADDLLPALVAGTESVDDEEDDEDMDEDEELARAIALSMQADGGDPDDIVEEAEEAKTDVTKEEKETEEDDDEDDITAALQDKDFLENLLTSIPGMEESDIAIDDILMNLGGDDEEDEEKDK